MPSLFDNKRLQSQAVVKSALEEAIDFKQKLTDLKKKIRIAEETKVN